MPKRRMLVLARHGQSDGNRRNVFTGWSNLPLTAQGIEEARAAGRRLATLGIHFDAAFTSALTRAARSCEFILEEMGRTSVPVIRDQALNERDYGALTGLNKDDARKRWGNEQVQIWRRSYAVAPPSGESLRDTVARVLPFFIREVLPAVMSCEAVLLVAHGNSLRALLMALDGFTPQTIPSVELATGEMRFYWLREDTKVESKEVLAP